jgi:hypothetical protein
MWLRHLQILIQHAQEWFLHAECDVETYECVYDTHKRDYNTYTCHNHTLRVEITLLCDVHTNTVMNTRTNIISERKVWFQYARVWFIYVEWDCSTQSAIFTRSVWFLHAECNFQTQCDFDTHKCDNDTYNCDFNKHKSVFHMQSAISTRRVWFLHAQCSLYTQSVISTRSMKLKRTNLITTIKTVISTRPDPPLIGTAGVKNYIVQNRNFI